MNYRFAWITVLLLAACTAAHAQGYMTATPWRATNLQHLAVWDNANRAAAGKDGNTLLRRAVRADRKARTVTLLAESCGLSANTTVEFAIVGETSDRTYEALLLTYARAKDIGDALEFIGLPRGQNVSHRAQRYWPSGERVVIKVREFGATNAPARPIEEFVLDRRINSTMVQRGFVYCGSPRVPGTEEGGAEACLADLEAPVSILSLYNEPQTLLDVPRISPQGEVYENYITNPDALLPAGRMMQVTLTPEPRPDGCPRVRPVELTILPSEGPGGVAFLLREGEKGEPQRIEAFGDLLKRLMAIVGQECDPMVTLKIDDAVPLNRAREVCKVLQKIEGENGVRMEPPPKGQIFYKSFLPDEQWRERAKRLTQPWELHVGPVSPTNAVPSLLLVQILEDWSDPNSMDPKLTPVEYPVARFEDIPGTIKKAGRGLPVLLVFAPASAPVGHFMRGVRPVLDTHSTVYVFPEP
ncbi:MAG: hypothetical protein GX174_04425 [Lentisphaerae bacterium]|jgi:hypothetical protein|nr:hypothetical protein [Lentisphaerota bacterium]